MNIVETLIGQNMKAHPDCLGLYIGLNEMYIAQTAQKDGGVVLESLLRVPVSNVDQTQLKPLDLNEAYFQMDNWLEALTKVASKKHWKTNKVVVSLSSSFCLLRHFVITGKPLFRFKRANMCISRLKKVPTPIMCMNLKPPPPNRKKRALCLP